MNVRCFKIQPKWSGYAWSQPIVLVDLDSLDEDKCVRVLNPQNVYLKFDPRICLHYLAEDITKAYNTEQEALELIK